MADVFISYKREERIKVEKLVGALTSREFSVWYDAGLTAGDAGGFDAEIEREISKAAAVVVCWTAEAVRSLYVRAEAKKGLERQILVPVTLERCAVPVPFNAVESIDLTPWTEEPLPQGFDRLAQRLNTLKTRAAEQTDQRREACLAALKEMPLPVPHGIVKELIERLGKPDSLYLPTWNYADDYAAAVGWIADTLSAELVAVNGWYDRVVQGVGSSTYRWETLVEGRWEPQETDYRGEHHVARLSALAQQLRDLTPTIEKLKLAYGRPAL